MGLYGDGKENRNYYICIYIYIQIGLLPGIIISARRKRVLTTRFWAGIGSLAMAACDTWPLSKTLNPKP